jgi:hypothetical protein
MKKREMIVKSAAKLRTLTPALSQREREQSSFHFSIRLTIRYIFC